MKKTFKRIIKVMLDWCPSSFVYKLHFLLFKKKRMYLPCAEGKSYVELLQDAFSEYLSEEDLRNKKLLKILTDDNINCFLKYQALPYEYFVFNFREKKDAERASFETDFDRIYTLKKVSSFDLFLHDINNKYNFYKLAKPFFKRKVFYFDANMSFDDFLMLSQSLNTLFLKPIASSQGQGVKIIHYTNVNSLKNEYEALIKANTEWLIEEKIEQCDEMAQWNPTSVNTIRIPTFYRNGKFTVIWTRMRMGKKGSIVDNLAAGGIVVSINPVTGVVDSDGYDDSYQHFECNPETGMRYKGWQVPRWSELLQIVEEMHKTIFPKHVYIAWDFALTPAGWVVIEANWGQLLGQQIVSQVGVRKQFHELVGAE